jgi:ATP-dependent Clp protease ATP-binding subunit ClpA
VFERFTDRARRVLVLAQDEARLLNHDFIGTEHVLLGLIREGEGIAAKALESLDISLEAVRQSVEELIAPAETSPKDHPDGHLASPPFTPRAKKVLELSFREALQLGHKYIGTEHMLLGLLREGEGVAAKSLVSLGADLTQVRQQVIQLLSGLHGKDAPDVVARSGGGRGRDSWDVGTRLTFEVVQAGRSPAASAAAFAAMASVLRRVGLDLDALDPEEVVVSSVLTNEGPGLRLVVHHLVDPDLEQPPEETGSEADA